MQVLAFSLSGLLLVFAVANVAYNWGYLNAKVDSIVELGRLYVQLRSCRDEAARAEKESEADANENQMEYDVK